MTLIELVIALGLTAALCLLAFPSYRDQVLRARRADAAAALMHMQQTQERWRSENDRYAGLTELRLAPQSPLGYYRLEIPTFGASHFELWAIAIDAQAHDQPCRVLRLVRTEEDTRHASGPDEHTLNTEEVNRTCWQP